MAFGPFFVGSNNGISARDISYNSEASGIEATTIQEALDKAVSIAKEAQTTGDDAMPKSGGAFTGAVTAAADEEYTAYQVRNAAILSATPSSMTNGAIAFVYT